MCPKYLYGSIANTLLLHNTKLQQQKTSCVDPKVNNMNQNKSIDFILGDQGSIPKEFTWLNSSPNFSLFSRVVPTNYEVSFQFHF